MKDKLFKRLQALLDPSAWKFLLVGAANTLFGTAVMFVFYNVFHFNYWIASASNYVFGSILSYFLNKYFTFQSRQTSGKEVMRFVVNITVCYLLAYGAAQPVIRMLFSGASASVQDNISMVAGMGFFVVINYFGQRYFVFRTNKGEA